MPKEKIAIISVLKPVDDVRAFHKMAKSLASIAPYHIHLFGYPSLVPKLPSKNIHFHPSVSFKRLSINRLLQPIILFIKITKLKPEVIVCNTHELLIVTSLCKILFGSKILYDIQENYYFNIRYQPNYPFLLRIFFSHLIRIKEIILSPIFDHFILAEKTYAKELSFLSDKYTIIENKALNSPHETHQSKAKDLIHVVFTGTITESNGILKALEIMSNLNTQDQSLTFSIVGHCPQKHIWDKLHEPANNFIQLNICSKPLPYETILEAISKADFGLITYQINPSNQHCVPTKVFEYLSNDVIPIFENKASWQTLIASQVGGIAIDFSSVDPKSLIEQMKNFEPKYDIDKTNLVWSSQETSLVQAIEGV